MPELPLNPILQGGAAAGPQRNPNIPQEVLALLAMLAQSGAGPGADALSRKATPPSPEMLEQLLFGLNGSFPTGRQSGAALRNLGESEIGPAFQPRPDQPRNIGQSQELLRSLLGG